MTRIGGKGYSKKFSFTDFPCLSLSCRPLCGCSLKRRNGVHVTQKNGNRSGCFLLYLNIAFRLPVISQSGQYLNKVHKLDLIL